MFSLIAHILSGVGAGLSAIAIPIWLMGVPGVENSYAKGWRIGLYAIVAYPVTWLCLFVFWFIARKQLDAEQVSYLSYCTGAVSLLLLTIAIAVVVCSFKIMSRR